MKNSEQISVVVRVAVEGEEAASIRITPTPTGEFDVVLTYCCAPHLVGVHAALSSAADSIQYEMWKCGLAGTSPEGAWRSVDEPPF